MAGSLMVKDDWQSTGEKGDDASGNGRILDTPANTSYRHAVPESTILFTPNDLQPRDGTNDGREQSKKRAEKKRAEKKLHVHYALDGLSSMTVDVDEFKEWRLDEGDVAYQIVEGAAFIDNTRFEEYNERFLPATIHIPQYLLANAQVNGISHLLGVDLLLIRDTHTALYHNQNLTTTYPANERVENMSVDIKIASNSWAQTLDAWTGPVGTCVLIRKDLQPLSIDQAVAFMTFCTEKKLEMQLFDKQLREEIEAEEEQMRARLDYLLGTFTKEVYLAWFEEYREFRVIGGEPHWQDVVNHLVE